MKQFIQLVKTEYKRIFSNRVLVLIFFGAPILYGLMFVQVYKKGKITKMEVVVIDEDNTPLSAKLIDAINDNENLKVAEVRYSAGNIAREMPSKEYVSVISIPEGFEAAVLQKRYPEIMVDVNTANLVTANFASRAIQTVMGTLNAGIEIEALKKTGMDAVTAAQRYEPFKVNYSRFYNPSGNYLNMMLPGILGTVMQQILFLGLGLVFARDFEDGYFNKLTAHHKNALYHIALKLFPFIALTALMWLIVGSFYVIYDIDIPVFTFNMGILVTVFSMACIFIGMLFSILIPNQLRATEFLMVIATPSFLLSGYTWPLSGMPSWIGALANTLPLTHFLNGFKRLSIYGGTLQDIYPQIAALGITTASCFLLQWVLLQWKINRQKTTTVG